MAPKKTDPAETDQPPTAFERLAAVNVGPHTEKKSNLTYLSWAWAWDYLMRADPTASVEYLPPTFHGGETVMVHCAVTAFGTTRRMQLPVMDHRNKAIPTPDAFAINTAMQRCMVKAIAMHGLGLYIYAGEDVPRDADLTTPEDTAPALPAGYAQWVLDLEATAATGTAALQAAWTGSKNDWRALLTSREPETWARLKRTAAAVPVKDGAA